jgi:hypothetical protein
MCEAISGCWWLSRSDHSIFSIGQKLGWLLTFLGLASPDFSFEPRAFFSPILTCFDLLQIKDRLLCFELRRVGAWVQGPYLD